MVAKITGNNSVVQSNFYHCLEEVCIKTAVAGGDGKVCWQFVMMFLGLCLAHITIISKLDGV
jgi:hypothetical protein